MTENRHKRESVFPRTGGKAVPAVSISDSTVNTSAVSPADRSFSFGICAFGTDNPNHISIVRSMVVSEISNGPALIACNMGPSLFHRSAVGSLALDSESLGGMVLPAGNAGSSESGASAAGSINLEGCEVVSPEGARICSLNSKVTLYQDGEGEEAGSFAGQFIGATDTMDAISMALVDNHLAFGWPDSISRKVVIKPIMTPEAPTAPSVVDGSEPAAPSVPGETERPTTPPTADETAEPTDHGSKKHDATSVLKRMPATGDSSSSS